MSNNDKMREAFEGKNPMPDGLVYQDFTDTYEFNGPGPKLTFRQKLDYNEAHTHFEEGWQAHLIHHQESEPDEYTADNLAEEVCNRLETILGSEIDGDGSPYSIAVEAVDFVVHAIKESGLKFDDEDNTFRQPAVQVPDGFLTVPREFVEEYVALLEGAKFKSIHSVVRIKGATALLAGELAYSLHSGGNQMNSIYNTIESQAWREDLNYAGYLELHFESGVESNHLKKDMYEEFCNFMDNVKLSFNGE